MAEVKGRTFKSGQHKNKKPRKQPTQQTVPDHHTNLQPKQQNTEIKDIIPKVKQKPVTAKQMFEQLRNLFSGKKCITILIAFSVLLVFPIILWVGYKMPTPTPLRSSSDQPVCYVNIKNNTVYDMEAIITHINNGTQIISNFDVIVAVENITDDGTVFCTSQITQTLESVYQDGEMKSQTKYRKNNIPIDILRYGAKQTLQMHNNTNETDDTNENITNGNTTWEGKQQIKTTLNVFSFQIGPNGVRNLIFPKDMSYEDLSNMKTIVNAFTPNLKSSFYSKEPVIQKSPEQTIQDTAENDTQSNENETDHAQKQAYRSAKVSFLQKQKYYRISQSNFSTNDFVSILKTSSNLNTSGPSRNTFQQSFKQSTFDVTGLLLNVTWKNQVIIQNSNTTQNKTENATNELTSTVLIDVNLQIHQKMFLNVKDNFLTKYENIKNFTTILKQSRTLNLSTMAELQAHIEQQRESANSRLLTGVLYNVTYLSREVKTLQINILGAVVKMYPYTAIDVELYEHDSNSYLKTPSITLRMGVILMVGNKAQKKETYFHEQQFEPRTYKLTLAKVNQLIEQSKPQFFRRVKYFQQLILNGNYEANIVPKIQIILDLFDKIIWGIESEQKQTSNATLAYIQQIYDQVVQIQNKLNKNVQIILNSQNQLVSNIVQQLQQIYVQRKSSALAQFQNSKSTFKSNSQTGCQALTQQKQDFITNKSVPISNQINVIVTSELNTAYLGEMSKIPQIRKLQNIVGNYTPGYVEYMDNSLTHHHKNLVKMTKGIVDLYFKNTTQIADSFVQIINDRRSNISVEYNILLQKLNSINKTKLTNAIIILFNSFIFDDLLNKSWLFNWQQIIQIINSYINGARREATDCCWWRKVRRRLFFRKKICGWWNGGLGLQYSEKFMFQMMNLSSKNLIALLVDIVNFYVLPLKRVMSDSSMPITQKYRLLAGLIQNSQRSMDLTRFDNLIDIVDERIDSTAKTIKGVSCGSYQTVLREQNDLKILKQLIVNFKNRWLEHIRFAKIQLARFDPEIYTFIMKNTYIVANYSLFWKIYQKIQINTLNYFSESKNFTQAYDAEEFAKSNEIAMKAYNYNQTISNSFNPLCVGKDTNLSEIYNFRGIYENLYNIAKNMDNDYMAFWLDQTKDFLYFGAYKIYEKFQNTPFCETQLEYNKNMSKLYPDWKNLTILNQFYYEMVSMQINYRPKMYENGNLSQNFRPVFSEIFTYQQYFDYIYLVDGIGRNISNTNFMISTQLAGLKQTAKLVQIFTMASNEEIMKVWQIFGNSSYTQSSDDMYLGMNTISKSAFRQIRLVSYDIVTVYVVCQDIQKYKNETLRNFSLAVNTLIQNYRKITQKFMNLNSSVTQQDLNDYQYDLSQIKNTNQTVVPKSIEKKQQIMYKFSTYYFTNTKMLAYYKNVISKLSQYSDFFEKQRRKVQLLMSYYIDYSINITQTLQIGALNSISILKNDFTDLFGEIMSDFPQKVDNVTYFETLVDEDFNYLYFFRQFYKNYSTIASDSYNIPVNTLLLKIDDFKVSLKSNPSFEAYLKSKQVYADIKATDNELFIDFVSLWGLADSNMIKIDDILNRIDPNEALKLKQWSQMKKNISSIRYIVELKINQTYEYYQQIRLTFFKLNQFIFVNLNDDFGVIVDFLNKISQKFTSIVDDDLQMIENLALSPRNIQNTYVGDNINKTLVKFKEIQKLKESFNEQIKNTNNKIGQFLQENFTKREQKLQDAYYFIISLTNLEQPKQNLTAFYQNPVNSDNEQKIIFVETIPLQIGWCKVAYVFNVITTTNGQIKIQNFRNVFTQFTQNTMLKLQVNFQQSQFRCFTYGVQINGIIHHVIMTSKFNITGLIPYSLVEPIAQFSQFTSQNVATLNFKMDREIISSKFSVSFYRRYVSLVIIWGRITICFQFWFIRFCWYFYIPIGYYYAYYSTDWGYNQTVPFRAQEQIFDLDVANWDYSKSRIDNFIKIQ